MKKIFSRTPISSNNTYLKNFYNSIENEYQLITGFKPTFKNFIFLPLNKNDNFDIIHYHWIYTDKECLFRALFCFLKQSFLVLYLKFILRKKIVFTLHNLYPHNHKFKILEKNLRKIYLKCADVILIHQKKLIKKIKKEFDIKENKIFYIKHGSYNVEPRKIKKSEINLYGKQMTTHNINLLIFGNIKRYKGIIEFLHYFKEKNFQNFQITIAGKPENNEINEDLIKLERNNKNIIVFNHFIPEEDTPTLFGLADYSILPYEEFTTSGVAIYSLSMGVPVIMPDSDFSNELLPNELYGYTFKDFKDVSNILEKINKINFERKKKIGDKFKKEYNWKDIGERTIEIFDKNL